MTILRRYRRPRVKTTTDTTFTMHFLARSISIGPRFSTHLFILFFFLFFFFLIETFFSKNFSYYRQFVLCKSFLQYVRRISMIHMRTHAQIFQPPIVLPPLCYSYFRKCNSTQYILILTNPSFFLLNIIESNDNLYDVNMLII